MTNKYYVVTAISQYRMRYVIPVEDLIDDDGVVKPVWAADTVTMGEAKEFSQLYLGETIVDVREETTTDVLERFDLENEYLSSWTTEKKLESIKNWRFEE